MEATRGQVHTPCLIRVGPHCRELGVGLVSFQLGVYAWPGSRLVIWPLNFSVLIFKQGHTAPVHQSCFVAGPPAGWCPVVCV